MRQPEGIKKMTEEQAKRSADKKYMSTPTIDSYTIYDYMNKVGDIAYGVRFVYTDGTKSWTI